MVPKVENWKWVIGIHIGNGKKKWKIKAENGNRKLQRKWKRHVEMGTGNEKWENDMEKEK